MWFVLLFACIDKAPNDSTLLRQTLTFRLRNQLYWIAEDIRDLHNTLIPTDGVSRPMTDGLLDVTYDISHAISPPNMRYILGCRYDKRQPHKYTLFSKWDVWAVEDDNMLYSQPQPISDVLNLFGVPYLQIGDTIYTRKKQLRRPVHRNRTNNRLESGEIDFESLDISDAME